MNRDTQTNCSIRLPGESGKFFQSPQLSNLPLFCFVRATALAESYFAHETIEEQLTESGFDVFVGKKK